MVRRKQPYVCRKQSRWDGGGEVPDEDVQRRDQVGLLVVGEQAISTTITPCGSVRRSENERSPCCEAPRGGQFDRGPSSVRGASTECVRMSHEVRRHVNSHAETGTTASLSARAEPNADVDRAQAFRAGIRRRQGAAPQETSRVQAGTHQCVIDVLPAPFLDQLGVHVGNPWLHFASGPSDVPQQSLVGILQCVHELLAHEVRPQVPRRGQLDRGRMRRQRLVQERVQVLEQRFAK